MSKLPLACCAVVVALTACRRPTPAASAEPDCASRLGAAQDTASVFRLCLINRHYWPEHRAVLGTASYLRKERRLRLRELTPPERWLELARDRTQLLGSTDNVLVIAALDSALVEDSLYLVHADSVRRALERP